ncbi:hypothetical protein [Streptomyces sp. NPDC046821]|uniref:hypothetical protein n=1 Tax=Streptomyces sp. NPDC046821 TaxID=3154702 RepID=UPI0033EE55A3
MAHANFNAAHPQAKPGYGKRSAPSQKPRTAQDFTHLPPREAAIAAYIDRLPEGADISVKTLAKHLPYGQCALRTALNRLQTAGHLRRGREHVLGSGSQHWITRTWFTRTARADDWWAAFVRGDAAPHQDEEPERPTRSREFTLLAALGRETPALSLSGADCTALVPQVAEWFERGATEDQIKRALTAGLPPVIHSPAALIRTRLTTKLPPEPAAPPARDVLRIMECAKCRAPGRPEALPGGHCRTCREGGTRPPRPADGLPTTAQVQAHAAAARMAMRAGA